MSIFIDENAEAKSAIEFLFRHYRKLFLALFFGIIIGLIITFFIPNKFRSVGIVYPPNSFNRSELIGNPQFGHETETEQLIQLLESGSIRDSVIEKFDLMSYYNLDTINLEWKDVLMRLFIDDIHFVKSRYLSVVISAEMHEPDLAADIVNYIIDVVSEYKKDVFDINKKSELEYFSQRVIRNNKKLDSISKIIYSFKDTLMADNLIMNYKHRISKDNYEDIDFIDSRRMENLMSSYDLFYNQSIGFENDYELALDAARKPLLKNYIIDRAFPSYKKVSPSLTTNGIIGGFVMLIITLLFLSLRDRIKFLKEKN